MKIAIVSDHNGYELKEYLKEEYPNLSDLGTTSSESVDYPDFAFKLAEQVASGEYDFGIAICGSGIGMSIACNKVKGIRCALVNSIDGAIITRNDNNSNIVAISSKMSKSTAKEVINAFITTPFSKEERHIRRVEKIRKYDNER